MKQLKAVQATLASKKERDAALANQDPSGGPSKVAKVSESDTTATAKARASASKSAARPAAPRPAEPSSSDTTSEEEEPVIKPVPKTPPTRKEKRRMEQEATKAAKAAERAMKQEQQKAAKAAKLEAAKMAKEAESGLKKATKTKRSAGDSAEERPNAKAKSAPKAKDAPEPDFEICWANHGKVMEHFNLSADEATATLMGILGTCEGGGETLWATFRKNQYGEDLEASQPKETAEPEKPTEQPWKNRALTSREQLEMTVDSQLPEDEHADEDDGEHDGEGDDGEEVSSSVSQHRPPPDAPGAGASVAKTAIDEASMIDTMDTLPMGEPTIEPVHDKSDDPGEFARQQLAAKMNQQPTPARSLKVWLLNLVNWFKNYCNKYLRFHRCGDIHV